MRRFVASVSALALSTGVVLVPHAFAQAKPSIAVISPGNGDTVTTTDIPVRVQVSNFTLSASDVGMPDKDGEGHIHVMLDGMNMGVLFNFYTSPTLTLPGQVTLEMGPESIASEFPTAMLQHGMPSAPLPHQDASEPRATLDVPSLQLGVSHVDVVSRIPTDTPAVERIDEAGDESVDAAVRVGDSGNLVSFPLQDVVLAEDAPMASVESRPEAIESTLPIILSMTADEASIPCADEVVPLLPPVIEEMPAAAETPPEGLLTSSDVFALEHLEASMFPEHLTLELESPVLSTDLASSLLPEATSMSLPASSDMSEMPTSTGPELGLPVVEALPVEDPDAIALPGHLTLEFDGSAIASEVSSIILDNLQLDNPPGNTQSNISPRDDQVDDEEELLLDLDSLELDDDAPA